MGSIISIIFVSWLGINSQIAETEGYISEFDKPMFNPNCTNCPEFQVMPLESNTKLVYLSRYKYIYTNLIVIYLYGIRLISRETRRCALRWGSSPPAPWTPSNHRFFKPISKIKKTRNIC